MKSNDNISSNPFMSILRTNFKKIYQSVAENQSILLVPSSASLVGVHITQILIESHILKSTHISNNFLNLVGQGIEFRDGCVYTSFGFKEQRVCNILQEENMYDFSTSFKVICIDRPLQGKFENITNFLENTSSSLSTSCDANSNEITIQLWLRNRADLLDKIHQILNRFRKTYVLVSGFEHDVAFRIQEICTDISSMLAKVRHVSSEDTQQIRYLHQIVEGYVYKYLHSFLWVHMIEAQKEKENILKKKVLGIGDDIQTLLSKFQVHSTFQDIVLDAAAEKLKEMDKLKSPDEKLECLNLVYQLINRAIDVALKKENTNYPNQNKIAVSCDLMLPLFIYSFLLSRLNNAIAHAVHIDMFMTHRPYENRLEKSSYLFTMFHSALSYLLQMH